MKNTLSSFIMLFSWFCLFFSYTTYTFAEDDNVKIYAINIQSRGIKEVDYCSDVTHKIVTMKFNNKDTMMCVFDAPGAQASNAFQIKNANGAKIKKSTAINSKIVSSLSMGSFVRVYEQKGNFYAITHVTESGKTLYGWILKNDVQSYWDNGMSYYLPDANGNRVTFNTKNCPSGYSMSNISNLCQIDVSYLKNEYDINFQPQIFNQIELTLGAFDLYEFPNLNADILHHIPSEDLFSNVHIIDIDQTKTWFYVQYYDSSLSKNRTGWIPKDKFHKPYGFINSVKNPL